MTPSTTGADEKQRIDFWQRQAHRLDWSTPWHTAHTFRRPERIPQAGSDAESEQFSVPRIEWFAGGRLNAAVNCVDRHVAAGRGDKTAVFFEGEPGDRATWTYAQLMDEVCRAANALQALGVGAGDRVVIYLPVIVETIVATLACARIGAVHSLVFGGFSAVALKFRIHDTGAKVLITSDGQFRRGQAVAVKNNADDACAGEDSIEHVLVVKRTGSAIPMVPGRDVWWHEALAGQPATHTPEFFDAEHPLFIIYTSGTTGKPKGLVHTTGGYLTQTAYTFALLFGLLDHDEAAQNNPDRVESMIHWCTADLAWVTAHTYEIYGPLLNGVTEVIYEGTPAVPHPGRHFEIIERYGVSTYYTAPTLVRSHMANYPASTPAAELPAAKWDLSSIRLVGTVGESVNPEAWNWLHTQVGRGSVPFIDTWWQSETGAAILSPRPSDACFAQRIGAGLKHTAGSEHTVGSGSSVRASTGGTGLEANGVKAAAPGGTSSRVKPTPGHAKPGCATRPIPGVSAHVVHPDGTRAKPGEQGLLVVDGIGPAMARTVWGDAQRYLNSYWARFGERGWFFSGDGARIDADGDVWVLGRVDDVINVSGHRLSTIEIESALLTHPWVVEAGTAPVTDSQTGHAVLACVVLSEVARDLPQAEVEQALRAHISTAIGPIAKPKFIVPVPEIPKTRSGKIMRRLLTQLHEDSPLGDTTSLQNEHAISAIAHIMNHHISHTTRRVDD